MGIAFNDFARQQSDVAEDLLQAIGRVLAHGRFVLGPEVDTFEQRFAAYCGTRFAVGVGDGTHALLLTLTAMGIGAGDEVITVPNSFFATAAAIALTGARPVFVDVGDDYLIDPAHVRAAVTPRTRAILPVHLTGRPAAMEAVLGIARECGVSVVEDCAQAVGAEYRGRRVGSFGRAGCFSFHPMKNLAALGDGGIITTDDVDLYHALRRLRNHGIDDDGTCLTWSWNSRLDALQAAVLLVKLGELDAWIARRRRTAATYRRRLSRLVRCPSDDDTCRAVWNTFVIQTAQRDALRGFLTRQGIETKIVHLPVPLHLQPAARALAYAPGTLPVAEAQARETLALPIGHELRDAEVSAVCVAVEAFFSNANPG